MNDSVHQKIKEELSKYPKQVQALALDVVKKCQKGNEDEVFKEFRQKIKYYLKED